MQTEGEFLTQEKKAELEKELQYRKGEKRQEILERLAFAKSLGDLSENAEYHSAKDDQGKNEARIAQIEAILKDAVIVEGSKNGEVMLGSKVLVFNIEKNEEKEYQIVGNEEADFSLGKISFSSPLGSSLLGHREGDEISVETPKGKVKYQIKKIIA